MVSGPKRVTIMPTSRQGTSGYAPSDEGIFRSRLIWRQKRPTELIEANRSFAL